MNLITGPEPSSPAPSGDAPEGEGADAPLDPKTEGPQAMKFLFMYRYPLVQNDKNHKLNAFTYKNVLFAEDQIVYFESNNEADPVKNLFIIKPTPKIFYKFFFTLPPFSLLMRNMTQQNI
jgi:hypothetical protein